MSFTGHCVCGAVEFLVKGPSIFNVLCHCKACSRARGMSPVHLIGFPASEFEYIHGEDKVSMGRGFGKMTHFFCNSCGTGIYQCPEGATFRAVYPTNFHIGGTAPGDTDALLPGNLLPSCHINYENRLFDWHDPLPKFKVWIQQGVRVSNSGEAVE